MPRYYELKAGEGVLKPLAELIRALLERSTVEAFLVPQHLPKGNMVQHTLVRDPGGLLAVDPLAPVLPVSGAVLAARLTRQDPGGPLGALLRPCEIRAFFELVKLHQGDRSRLLVWGIDCLGTFEPMDFQKWAADGGSSSEAFFESMLSKSQPPEGAPPLRRCCRACEFPFPEGADIRILLVGTDGAPCLEAATAEGEETLASLGLPQREAPAGRQSAAGALVERREASRDLLFRETEASLLPFESLLEELSSCINCHNCRDACPVCYCRNCVFDSGTFEHPSSQYLQWAKRKGLIKMPTETLFFHITRMAHMSTSCVGCGQCSSACPMGIRVADIFRTVARRTQSAFQYVPGRDLDEPLPLSTFREDELQPG